MYIVKFFDSPSAIKPFRTILFETRETAEQMGKDMSVINTDIFDYTVGIATQKEIDTVVRSL